jgi:SAM-dependent methyltransferase
VSDDVRVRNGYRRRRTTRRLLRHPARIAARPDQSEQQLKLDVGASTRLQLDDGRDDATLEAPVVEEGATGVSEASSASPQLTAAAAPDADFTSDDETTDVADRDRPGELPSEPQNAAPVEPVVAKPAAEAVDAGRLLTTAEPSGPAAALDAEAADADAGRSLTAVEPSEPAAALDAEAADSIEVPVSDRAPLVSEAQAGADGDAGFEPKTNELQRPAAESGAVAVDKALEQAGSAAEFSPLQSAGDAAADGGETTTGPEAGTAVPRKDEGEVKTKPKIRLPEGAPRRATPPPPTRSSMPAPAGRISSPVPPRLTPHAGGPLPPAPAGASVPPIAEGIVRTSQPPVMRGANDRDSEAPTRPRIPLTHDMALAAGRITSQEVTPFGFDDASLTRPRVPAAGDGSVLVTRARVISDRPASAESGEAATPILRRSRRPRPDSEEFETLDIEDGEEDTPRLELDGIAARTGNENGVRVSRTPPPPPSSNQGKRPTGAQAVQRAAPPPPPPTAAAKKPAPAVGQKAQPKKRAWWEVLFSDDYVRTLPRLSSNTVGKQVSFMEASLGIKRGDAVLDVGCGLGQHALEFARRGYLVVALDLALSMITRAAEEAQQRGLRINFLHKDIRDIGFEGTFDAIICVGTTFGFFDDEQNRNVLGRLAHALKPGGKLLIEIINRDYVLRSQPNLVWFEGEGCVVMEESDFNYYSSRLNVKRTMMREDGRQSESEYSIRLYSVHELGQLLKQAGFSIKEVSGQEATRGLFFGSHSTRIIMLAERRTTPRGSNEQSVPPGADG